MRNFPLSRKRIDPFFGELDFGKVFENFFGSPFKLGFGFPGNVPVVDIYEKGSNVFVKAELPGANPEELKLSVDGNLLTISGEKRHEKEAKKENCYQLESAYGTIRRTVELPTDVKAEGARANYKNGVLTVELPKSDVERQKEIKIDRN